MKLLIAVKSCGADRSADMHRTIRETWGRDVQSIGADLMFFVGGSAHVSQLDEVLVSAKDDFHSLPYKVREMAWWALTRGYDNVFFCDTDTFVIPRKLMEVDFQNFDYVGKIDKEIGKTFSYIAPDWNKKDWYVPNCYPWASGGVGYFLSNAALQIIAAHEPSIWAEDLWVGQVMGLSQIKGFVTIAHSDKLNWVATWHFPKTVYERMLPIQRKPIRVEIQEWMQKMYLNNGQK